MKNFFYSLLLLLSYQFSAAAADQQLIINSDHLQQLTESDKKFVPVKTEYIEADEKLKDQGVQGRLLISWGVVNSDEFTTTYHKYDENGEETSSTDIDAINTYIADHLELKASNYVTVEYYVTNSFTIELSDYYREYGLDGENVGEAQESDSFFNFTGDSSTDSTTGLNHIDRIHDFQLGVNYIVPLMKTKSSKLELALKGNVGLVHLDTKTTYDYMVGEEVLHEYNGLAGYSYGGGAKVRYNYKRFFVQAGVEYRNYVLAPTKNDDGSSQEVHQNGFNYLFAIGWHF